MPVPPNRPVSQWGTEISFPLVCNDFPCHPKGPNNTVMNITNAAELKAHRLAYADLAKTFDPVDFDPVGVGVGVCVCACACVRVRVRVHDGGHNAMRRHQCVHRFCARLPRLPRPTTCSGSSRGRRVH